MSLQNSLQDEYSGSEQEKERKILHEGYLQKKGQINRSWKKRYFVLYEHRKFAYFTTKESVTSQPINEINLSTVKSISLIPYSNNPNKFRAKSRAKSMVELFKSRSRKNSKNNMDQPSPTSNNKKKNKEPHSPLSENQLNHNNKSSDDDDDVAGYNNDSNDDMDSDDSDNKDNHSDVWVDAPINNAVCCSKKNTLELRTHKRAYWLSCKTSNELSEWIVHLKYSIFGKKIIDGYLTKKLKTKWKKRFVEIYESKTMRIYKDKTKKKERGQIDLEIVAVIKHGKSEKHKKPFPIEIIYKNDNNNDVNINHIDHLFSCSNKSVRDKFMDSFYQSMNGKKLNILCEGYLHFRAEEVKCWKCSYFALIQGSLIQFDKEDECIEFKNCIYQNELYYNYAFSKYVLKSLPMNDPLIEKLDNKHVDNENKYKHSAPSSLLEALQIFTVTTTIGKWYFGCIQPTKFLLWCQSFQKYINSSSRHINNIPFAKVAQNKVYSDDEADDGNINKFDNVTIKQPNLLLDINKELTAINDEKEKDEDAAANNNAFNLKKSHSARNKKLNAAAIMSINMDKHTKIGDKTNFDQARPMMSTAKSQPISRRKGHLTSQSLVVITNNYLINCSDDEDDYQKYKKNNKKEKNDENKYDSHDDDDHDDNDSNHDINDNEEIEIWSNDDEDDSDDDSDDEEVDCLSITNYNNESSALHHVKTNTNTFTSDKYFIEYE